MYYYLLHIPNSNSALYIVWLGIWLYAYIFEGIGRNDDANTSCCYSPPRLSSLQNTARGGTHSSTTSEAVLVKEWKSIFSNALFHMIAFSRHVRLDDGVRRFVSSAFRIGLSSAIIVFSLAWLTAFGGKALAIAKRDSGQEHQRGRETERSVYDRTSSSSRPIGPCLRKAGAVAPPTHARINTQKHSKNLRHIPTGEDPLARSFLFHVYTALRHHVPFFFASRGEKQTCRPEQGEPTCLSADKPVQIPKLSVFESTGAAILMKEGQQRQRETPTVAHHHSPVRPAISALESWATREHDHKPLRYRL